jgi:hypothetical protein
MPVTFIFLPTCHLLISTWSLKLIRSITTSFMCFLYNNVETLNVVIMNERYKFHLPIVEDYDVDET